MTTKFVGALAILGLALSATLACAGDRPVNGLRDLSGKGIPVVQVLALNAQQAERLLSERKRHQEALKKLQAEHEKALNAILASPAL